MIIFGGKVPPKKKAATTKAKKKTASQTQQPQFTDEQLEKIDRLIEILTDFVYPGKRRGFTKAEIEKLGKEFGIFLSPKLTKAKQIELLVTTAVEQGIERPLEILEGFDQPVRREQEEEVSEEDISFEEDTEETDFEADSEDISIFDNNSVYSVVDRIGQLRVT